MNEGEEGVGGGSSMGTVRVLERVGDSLECEVTTAGGTLRGRGFRGDGDGDRGEASVWMGLLANLCAGVVGTLSWDVLALEKGMLLRPDVLLGKSVK